MINFRERVIDPMDWMIDFIGDSEPPVTTSKEGSINMGEDGVAIID